MVRGFPRLKRPNPAAAPPAPAAVEATPAAREQQAAPRTGFPGLPTRPATSSHGQPCGPSVPPSAASGSDAESPDVGMCWPSVREKYTRPHEWWDENFERWRAVMKPQGPRLTRQQYIMAGLTPPSDAYDPPGGPPPGIWVPIPDESAEPPASEPLAEPEYDEEGRRIITTPLELPPRRTGVMWQPAPAIHRTPVPPWRTPLPRPVFQPPAPVKSDAPAASTRPPAPLPRVSMNDAGKFPLRPPANKPQQVTASRTPKLPPLTADDIPFD
jgi:hypothetical protein